MRFSRTIFILCVIVPFLRAGVSFAAEADDTVRARVVFVGDIMVHDQQLESARYDEEWDFKPQFRRVKPLFWRSLSVGNLETVFAGNEQDFSGFPAFNTPDELASALADLEMDIVMLANNHILDHGFDAALRTTKVLDDSGIFWTGLVTREDPDEPLVVEYGGLRWAFVNYSYGSNNKSEPSKPEDLMLNVISENAIVSGLARALIYEPDITVAFFHWGLEYQYNPTRNQNNIAEICLENGADLVIGAHPHVLQPIEVTSSDRGYSVIAYSLGNFISYQRTKPWERSIILAIDVEKKAGGSASVSRVSAAPIWVSARRGDDRERIEVMYAGAGGPFNHGGLPAGEIALAREAGRAVLDFLGASEESDPAGFYTLWDAASPDIMPQKRRETPE